MEERRWGQGFIIVIQAISMPWEWTIEQEEETPIKLAQFLVFSSSKNQGR